MASQTQGIQQLLAAEKRSSDKVKCSADKGLSLFNGSIFQDFLGPCLICSTFDETQKWNFPRPLILKLFSPLTYVDMSFASTNNGGFNSLSGISNH